MKLNSPLRRAATVLAGALLGLSALTVAASPASAHDSKVSGEASCDTATGTRYVTWTLTNDYKADATADELKTTPNAIGDLAGDPVIPKAESRGDDGVRQDGTLVLTQKITAAAAEEASISYKTLWAEDGFTDGTNSAKVALDAPCSPVDAPCVQPDQAKFTHTFAVSDEGSTATVSLDEGIDLCAGEPVSLVSYFAPKPEFAVPQYKFDSDTDTITNVQRSVRLTIEVPKCNTQVDLVFGDIIPELTKDPKTRYGNRKLGSDSGLGGRSKGPKGWHNGGSKGCQTPAVEPLPQCDGTIAVNLSNDGLTDKYPIDFTVKAGSFSKTVRVTKGKGETVVVPAGSGTVTISAEGLKDVVYNWAPPADCELPSVIVENDCDTVTITVENPKGAPPAIAKISYGDENRSVTVPAGKTAKVTFELSDATYATIDFPGLDVEPIKATLGEVDCDNGGGGGGGGNGDDDGGGLPVTGPVAGSVAGGAALLLVAGGVLLFLARRRKLTFTA